MQRQKFRESFQPTLDKLEPDAVQKKRIAKVYWPVFIATYALIVFAYFMLIGRHIRSGGGNVGGMWMAIAALSHFAASKVCRMCGLSFESRTRESIVRSVGQVSVSQPYQLLTGSYLWQTLCVFGVIGMVGFTMVAFFTANWLLCLSSAALSAALIVVFYQLARRENVLRVALDDAGVFCNQKRIAWEKVDTVEIVTTRNAFGAVASTILQFNDIHQKKLGTMSLASVPKADQDRFLQTLRQALKQETDASV
jgi:hypothetical protein